MMTSTNFERRLSSDIEDYSELVVVEYGTDTMEDELSTTDVTLNEMDKHRNNITVIMLTTNATPFKKYGYMGYACCFCVKVYMNAADLKKHTIESHDDNQLREFCKDTPLKSYLTKLDITNLICSICNDPIGSLEDVFDHLEEHGLMIYRDIKNHIIPFKFDSDKHICAICWLVFHKFSILRDHLNKHYQNYICKLCNAGFVNKGMLMIHEQNHDIDTYKCDHCDKVFNLYKSKRSHERNVHNDYVIKNKEKDASDDVVIDEGDEDTTALTKFEQKREVEKHRDNIFTILRHTNATPFGKRTDAGYACCFCKEDGLDSKELKEHTLITHRNAEDFNGICKSTSIRGYIVKLDITSLFCKICGLHIDNLEELFDHLEKHGKVIHRDIKNHIVPFIFNSGTHVCAICSSSFNKFKLLREHMNVHFNNYICNVCNAGFVNEKMLISHMNCHKTGVYTCDHCTKTFTTSRSKKNHEYMVHVKNNYASSCGICNQKFKTYRMKNNHLTKVHGMSQVKVSCKACNKTFEGQSKLTLHVKRYHLMERKHKCGECERKFFSRRDLKRHLVKHTGAKKFSCDICGKTFAWRRTVRDHMRIHTNDKPYKCEYCKRAFIIKNNWRSHMRRRHDVHKS